MKIKAARFKNEKRVQPMRKAWAVPSFIIVRPCFCIKSTGKFAKSKNGP